MGLRSRVGLMRGVGRVPTWVRKALMCALMGVCVASAGAATRRVSVEAFRSDLAQMQGLVTACGGAAAACDASKVVGDERVGELSGDGKEGGGYEVHWGWLRDSLKTAKEAKAEDRVSQMKEAETALVDMAADAGSPAGDTSFGRERKAANDVLAGKEFQGADTVTWWDRLKARVFGWIGRIFYGVGQLGEMAPWIGRLLEWLLFVGAAVGVMIFLLRSLQRQRLKVSLAEGAAKATAWDREGTDWAKLAEGYAAEGAWRDAVHCLYWAAIVTLEGRRAWRHNPTRTPREYVRLLNPGSAQQQGLRGLTQIFERVWYGLRDAKAEEYARAKVFYEELAKASDGIAKAGVAS
jgi:hypothetical protein